MNRNVKVFSADEVDLMIAGILINSGYSEGEFVSIEMASDDFGDKAGADGEVARFKTNDRRATMKVKLLQTSQGNDTLNQLRKLGIDGINGADVGVFELVDRSSGAVLAHADKAWVQKPPTVSRGKEVGETEWTLRAAHMDLDILGNPSI